MSALAEHLNVAHGNLPFTIFNFDLDIVKKCEGPVEARLAEARAISVQRPQINRKHEKENV